MAKGWQLDGSIYPDAIGYKHLNQWRFRRRDHLYMFAFDDFRRLPVVQAGNMVLRRVVSRTSPI